MEFEHLKDMLAHFNTKERKRVYIPMLECEHGYKTLPCDAFQFTTSATQGHICDTPIVGWETLEQADQHAPTKLLKYPEFQGCEMVIMEASMIGYYTVCDVNCATRVAACAVYFHTPHRRLGNSEGQPLLRVVDGPYTITGIERHIAVHISGDTERMHQNSSSLWVRESESCGSDTIFYVDDAEIVPFLRNWENQVIDVKHLTELMQKLVHHIYEIELGMYGDLVFTHNPDVYRMVNDAGPGCWIGVECVEGDKNSKVE